MAAACPVPPLAAVIVGHTLDAPGAVNRARRLSEYAFNDPLARQVARQVDPNAARVTVVHRPRPDNLRGLVARVNELEPVCAIELHANAAPRSGSASGTEVLYWHSSLRGRRLADLLQAEILAALELPDRGVKAIGPGGRGAVLLRGTRCPCVIAEPFFIDADADLGRAEERAGRLAVAYARAIEIFARELGATSGRAS